MTLDDLTLVLDEINKTSGSIRTLTEKVMQDDSTVNRLITEEDLYLDLQKTISRMDSLLLDIQENPKRYFKFSVF